MTLGASYDRLHYPENHRFPPVAGDQATTSRLSPKAGFIWTPNNRSSLRGAYTRSLGGVSFDQSFRLEPNEVGGFIQSYRSLIPESVAGSTVAPTFETGGLSFDHQLKTWTYVGLTAEWLESKADRLQGVFQASTFDPIVATGIRNHLKFRERTLTATVNQLLGDGWSLGVRYRASQGDLEQSFAGVPGLKIDNSALLHEAKLSLFYNHPSGFFAHGDTLWLALRNYDYNPDLPGDDFWQVNVYAGYRFAQRRVEVRLGLLNLADQDYKLNPLNVYGELPRERTLALSLKLNY